MRSNESAVDQRLFRNVLGRFPTGVTIITAKSESGEPLGMVVGSFTSVSLDPPLVAFLPATSSSTFPHIKRAGTFCVNVLSAEQASACQQFFGGDPADRFATATWRPSPRVGAPILQESVAWIECEIDTIHEAGDHFIVVGKVVDLDVAKDSLPLIFFRGGYGRFSSLSLAAWADDGVLEQLRYVDLARPAMEALATRLDMECLALTRVGAEMMVLASSGTMGEHHVPTRVGMRFPLVPPMGALFVAWAGDTERAQWKALRPGSDAELESVLARIQDRGWSVGLGSEAQQRFDQAVSALHRAPGSVDDVKDLEAVIPTIAVSDSEPEDLSRVSVIRSVSAPVFDAGGAVPFMLTAFGFRELTSGRVAEIRDEVVAAAKAVTQEIGGRSPLQ